MGLSGVTIFVRHGAVCKYRGDEFSKRCQCKKHLRWTHNGSQFRRATGARSWAEAETAKRSLEDQLSGKPVETVKTLPKSVEEAILVFLQDKSVQDVTPNVLKEYKRQLARFRDFAEREGVFTIQGVTRELLTGYCATWTEFASSGTRAQHKKKLSGFLKFCYEAEWIVRKFKLPKITIDQPPTLPLTADEYSRLLAAVPMVAQGGEIARLRGLFQLMRWTGLAIRDALTLERAEIQTTARGYRVTTSRQKTGTHVSVPIPPVVALEILAVPNAHPKYIFWNGMGNPKNFSGGWSTTKVAPAFAAAGIPDVCHMKSHRLRDTFAVDLLEKGLPLEELSKLLGHESIKTTETHYAAWVQGRQDRLDELVTRTWQP